MTAAESLPPAERIASPAGFTLRELLAYFLWLGTFGFGGPIALVGYMQRDLVERRRWFSRQDYSEGLALAQLAPGPLAAQLAIYLGWLKAGTLGATLVAGAFILPSFLMVLLLSFLYLRFEGLAWMRGVFYGIGAAVIAIIARSAWKLMRSTLERDTALWLIFLASATVTAWTESEIAWIFLVAGVAYLLVRLPARRARVALAVPWPLLFSGLHGPADTSTLWRIAWYFAEAGAFVFGSGLAIVPFLHGGVVNEFQVADRAAVPRRRRGGHDHAGAGRHHRGVHRIPRGGTDRRNRRRLRRLPALLPLRRDPGGLFSAAPSRIHRFAPSCRA